jgi:hypothetical protein
MNLVQVGLRLPEDMVHTVKLQALTEKTTMQELITKAVKDYLANQSGE